VCGGNAVSGDAMKSFASLFDLLMQFDFRYGFAG
jgi:hypothetical protein